MNRNRVPSFSTIFQVIFTAIVVLFVYIIVPSLSQLFGNTPTNSSLELYSIIAAATTLIWTLATLFIFVDLVFLYLRNPADFVAKRQFPLWVIWLSVFVGGMACLATIVGILVYSWIPLISNSSWWIDVGGLALTVLIIAAFLSALANSEAAWESMAN